MKNCAVNFIRKKQQRINTPRLQQRLDLPETKHHLWIHKFYRLVPCDCCWLTNNTGVSLTGIHAIQHRVFCRGLKNTALLHLISTGVQHHSAETNSKTFLLFSTLFLLFSCPKMFFGTLFNHVQPGFWTSINTYLPALSTSLPKQTLREIPNIQQPYVLVLQLTPAPSLLRPTPHQSARIILSVISQRAAVISHRFARHVCLQDTLRNTTLHTQHFLKSGFTHSSFCHAPYFFSTHHHWCYSS